MLSIWAQIGPETTVQSLEELDHCEYTTFSKHGLSVHIGYRHWKQLKPDISYKEISSQIVAIPAGCHLTGPIQPCSQQPVPALFTGSLPAPAVRQAARQAALWWTVLWWLVHWYTTLYTVVAGTHFTVQHRTQESLPVDALP